MSKRYAPAGKIPDGLTLSAPAAPLMSRTTQKAVPLMGFNRNVPGWERALRAFAGLTLLIVAVLLPLTGWALAAALAIGAALVVTALAGFCPACAMVGRRP